MTPFIIYALPRSRTFWLSRFLSYNDWNCGHDELRHARSMDDVKAWFSQPNTGTVETSAAPWWRLVPADVRTITIRRPVADVVESLARLGFEQNVMLPLMKRLDRKLDQIERRVPGVLSVRFADLENEGACRELFEHCLPYPHDPEWWAEFAGMNLQVSMSSLVRYMAAYRPQMEKLAKIAKHRTIAGMTRTRMIDCVTIQEEPFDDAMRDGAHLFEAHCVAVGEAPDNWKNKNTDLMRELYQMGRLFVTTARSNGRLFGYLQTMIGPSLESPHEQSAINLLFYADTSFPGLGLKLQHAAVDGLKRRGVDEAFFRAGIRGSGPRLDVLYRRMGAEQFGQLYRLPLKDVA